MESPEPQEAATPSPTSPPASPEPIEDLESRIRLDIHLDPEDDVKARQELRAALQENPRRIPSRFFYDDRGSRLFEQICELPEYYQTRTEAALLEQVADDIVTASGAEELVEIGSGAATKTRILLDAMQRAHRLLMYVPIDVSEAIVRRSAHELAAEYPELRIHGVVGDFLRHLEEIPDGGNRLFIFLGGTIGNLELEGARELLRDLGREMRSGDHFLLGTDRIKDVARLEAAYNDSAGVTAAFNLNILHAVNRLADADFDPAKLRHRAFYNREQNWIEMRLVALEDQTVRAPGLDLTFELSQGEELLTEISVKYDREKVEALLEGSGFELLEWYTDAEDLFGLSLARKT